MINASHKNELITMFDQEPRHILQKAKEYWSCGNWEALSSMPFERIKKHPDRANLVLLMASAYQHLEDYIKAEHYIKKAIKWGCNTKTIAKVCLADAYNSLARIAALNSDDRKVQTFFSAAVNIDEQNDIELTARSRAINEMAKLGLLPQATTFIDQMLKTIKDKPSTIKNIAAQTKIIETELELLTHELNISLQKNQLYSQVTPQVEQTGKHLLVGTPAYMENLRKKSTSQLGQDMWVLEKSNFKRNGFFVEFGATDGVLLSNSYLLEKEFDWQGICAEPNPKFFDKLKQNRKCIVSNECIGAKTGEKIEFVFAQEYGGMQKHMANDKHKEKREAYLEQGYEMEMETISLHDFLLKHNAPRQIDFLSIDTEGSEYEILENFPFDLWNITLITAEHNFTDNRKIIRALLEKNGYTCEEAQWDDWYIKQ